MTDRIISLDAAQRVVHETIVNLCIADKNTCAGDYSAACLEALSALPAVDDSPDLLTFMAVVSAAGGKITVLPKDAVKAREMALERFDDPKSGGFAFRLTPLPAPPEIE